MATAESVESIFQGLTGSGFVSTITYKQAQYDRQDDDTYDRELESYQVLAFFYETNSNAGGDLTHTTRTTMLMPSRSTDGKTIIASTGDCVIDKNENEFTVENVQALSQGAIDDNILYTLTLVNRV